MNKRIYILSVLAMMFLVSCAPTELDSTVKGDVESVIEALNAEKPSDIPKTVQTEVTEAVSVDADIRLGEISEYKVFEQYVKRKDYTQEEAIQLVQKLLDYIGKSDAIKQLDIINEGIVYEDGTPLILNCVSLDNDFESVGVSINGISYDTVEWFKIASGPFSLDFQPVTNRENYRTGMEMSIGSVEEYEKKARELVSEMGVEINEDVICYSLDEETMRKEREEGEGMSDEYYEKVGVSTDFEKKDEAYCFSFFPSLNGIPYYYYSINKALTNTECIFGSKCTVCYNAEGLIFYETGDMFVPVRKGIEQNILKPGEILEKQIERLKSLSSAGDIEIQEIALQYLPILEKDTGEYHVIPVWTVAYVQEVTYQGATSYTLNESCVTVFDAVTGDVLQAR